MAIFGFVVICILAAIAAIILASLLIAGSIYLISYIKCDFESRKVRWAIEARDRHIHKYIENLSKYSGSDADEMSKDDEAVASEDDEYAGKCEEEDFKTEAPSEYEDIINKVCE